MGWKAKKVSRGFKGHLRQKKLDKQRPWTVLQECKIQQLASVGLCVFSYNGLPRCPVSASVLLLRHIIFFRAFFEEFTHYH
jgi:hypothetical protein